MDLYPSPDGRRIRVDTDLGLYEAVRGRALRRLGPSQIEGHERFWSPDGHRIAYHTYSQYRPDAAPGQEAPVMATDRAIIVDQIASASSRSPHHRRAPPASHTVLEWSDGPGNPPPSHNLLGWSRNNHWLLITHNFGPNGELHLTPWAYEIHTGERVRLIDTPAPIYSLDWHER